MEKNIRRFYWYRLTKYSLFHIAIFILFYQQRGLSFSQIMILQSIYYFAKVLSEVPTGALADRVGRKKSLVVGSFCHSFAYLLIFFSHSLFLFMLGEIIAGIAMSFAYGADSALAYDTLKGLGKSEEYQKIEGNANSMRHLGFAIFAPLGGLLATIDLSLPYLASSIGIFFSGLIALTLVEPPREDQRSGDSVSNARKRSYHEIRKSLDLLLGDKKILWFVLFFAAIFMANRLGFWTYQPYMKLVGLPLSLFGVAFAAFHLFSAVVSRQAGRMERLFKENLILLAMPILVVTSFVLLSRFLYIWAISFILIQQVTTAIHEPVLKTYINRRTPSEVRATMLSVQHMAGNAAFAIFAPFLGSLVDQFRLENALLIFALVVIIFSVLLWRYRVKWFRSVGSQPGHTEEAI
ncbi:MAG: MFS transporter [Candidatus Zixiibacteriota bacterium]|nr:MAG: MFS transporter [candidate division Zixibacteria bacterium]